MNKKNGFTLVELLAVIVILAVILVIAVPSIISTITESRKGALASSTRLIASSAETMKISNDTLGITSEIRCEDVANISNEDYDTCKIDFVDGDAYVSIIGKGKFEGMAVLSGTVEKAEVIRTTGLELTDDGNIRYTGKNPNNYVEFGNTNELWRIIGSFTVTTSDGKQEKLMKIVRGSSIGVYSWDSSKGNNNGTHETGEVNDGNGVNEWSQADLMTELNTLYLNKGSGTCYNGSNEASTTCNFSTKGINSTYRSMIENVVWNTAGVTWDASGRTGQSAKTAYESERGTTTGKLCTSGAYCTDTVTRTTTWEGLVGLIYPSDYGYASTNEDCRNWINARDEGKRYCKNDNWLHTGSNYWTLSPRADSGFSRNAWRVVLVGCANGSYAHYGNEVRPSVYLKSNVSITSGEGTQTSPYHLSMN